MPDVWSEIIRAGLPAVLLGVAVVVIWRRQTALERRNEKLHSEAHAKCAEENKKLQERLVRVEDCVHNTLEKLVGDATAALEMNISYLRRISDHLDITPPEGVRRKT
jgi:hypothetical protein